METILMKPWRLLWVMAGFQFSLNPFYIMETILIKQQQLSRKINRSK